MSADARSRRPRCGLWKSCRPSYAMMRTRAKCWTRFARTPSASTSCTSSTARSTTRTTPRTTSSRASPCASTGRRGTPTSCRRCTTRAGPSAARRSFTACASSTSSIPNAPPPSRRQATFQQESSTMKLRNKVAIVTGAASGIGKEIALRYAREGARVAIADLNLQAAQAVAGEITRADGKALALAMDVTNEEQVNAATAGVVREWDGVDVLVSNAGIQIVHPLEEFPFADWKKMLAIHLDGAFLTTRAVLPHMQRSGRGGSIIYMGSVHSKEASVLKSAYVTAKHGLIGLAKTVAKEGGKHRIRANVICPGFVRTPLVDKQIPEQAQALGMSEQDVVKNVMLKETVDGEFTTVQDVAEVAVLFAGFDSNALTGQSLVVSHGWYMQ